MGGRLCPKVRISIYATLLVSHGYSQYSRWYYRSYFKDHVDAQICNALMHRNAHLSMEQAPTTGQLRSTLLHQAPGPNAVHHQIGKEVRQRSTATKIRPDMVRRVDTAPQRINPTGIPALAVDVSDGGRTHSGRQHVQDSEDRMPRTQTRVTITDQPHVVRPLAGFGGFPGPQDLVSRLLRRMFPRFYRNVQRTLTMPRTQTFVPHDSVDPGSASDSLRQVPYFSFKAVVGRNSVFLNLTEEQMNELGGVEYRALNTLLWVAPLVRRTPRHSLLLDLPDRLSSITYRSWLSRS